MPLTCIKTFLAVPCLPQPFLLITPSKRLGREDVNCKNAILSHSCFSFDFSCWTIHGFRCFIFRFTMLSTFLIGGIFTMQESLSSRPIYSPYAVSISVANTDVPVTHAPVTNTLPYNHMCCLMDLVPVTVLLVPFQRDDVYECLKLLKCGLQTTDEQQIWCRCIKLYIINDDIINNITFSNPSEAVMSNPKNRPEIAGRHSAIDFARFLMVNDASR